MSTIITTQEQARATKHVDGVQFECSGCGEIAPVQTSGGTGYRYTQDNNIICYACCGAADLETMRTTGKIGLYLSGDKVTNWPGTLCHSVDYIKRSWHNFAGKDGRTDFWFTGPDNTKWHGYNIGHNNQIAHCRRLKK